MSWDPNTYDPNDFDRPSVAVDVVILTVDEGALKVVLIQRTESPYDKKWSLPGGFVGIDESLEDAAARLLEKKAGLKNVFLEQLYTFGAPKRDPRMRIISVAYYALIERSKLEAQQLFDVAEKKDLAFDHAKI